jgi:hypothetical protein
LYLVDELLFPFSLSTIEFRSSLFSSQSRKVPNMAAIEKDDLYTQELEKTNTTWDDRSTLDPELDRRITKKFDKHGAHKALCFYALGLLVVTHSCLSQSFPGFSGFGFWHSSTEGREL